MRLHCSWQQGSRHCGHAPDACALHDPQVSAPILQPDAAHSAALVDLVSACMQVSDAWAPVYTHTYSLTC